MANQISLLNYLQNSPPAVNVFYHGQSQKNTRSDSYDAGDIVHVGHWPEFNLNTILQQYGAILNAAQIPRQAPPTPPSPVNDEGQLRGGIEHHLGSWVKHALRGGFDYMSRHNQLAGLSVVKFGHGSRARIINRFKPDYAFFDAGMPQTTSPNRCPGDCKPSYKWSMELKDSTWLSEQTEFAQVLSQVNFYMKQHHARYGFVLTDRELVAIRRLDDRGNIDLSSSIHWDTWGTAAQPQLTVMLALWYLGMLAADDQGWRLP